MYFIMKCTSYNLWPNTQGWVFLFGSVCLYVRQESVWLYKILNKDLGKKCSFQFGQWPRAICSGLCELLRRMWGSPSPTSWCGHCAGVGGHGLDFRWGELSLPAQGSREGGICRKRWMVCVLEPGWGVHLVPLFGAASGLLTPKQPSAPMY